MKKNFLGVLLFLFFFFQINQNLKGQSKLASPRDSVTGHIGNITVSINYGSPAVKDRVIWGRLVPYGQVWRAGANEATRIKFDKTVSVSGKSIPPGEYSFFVIPDQKQWILIFNSVAYQWGAFEYSAKEDIVRVTVIPETVNQKTEHLRYQFKNNKLYLEWDLLSVPIPITEPK